MRSIGMDVHCTFVQIAVVEDGLCRNEGKIGVRTVGAMLAWPPHITRLPTMGMPPALFRRRDVDFCRALRREWPANSRSSLRFPV
jgi:hypothetical protein